MNTMTRSNYKSIPWIVLLRLFGLVFFIIFLYIANNLAFFTENPLNYQIIQFLNNNFWLIIVMSIIFLFGEVFNALIFPFNLPAPLFNASASVLLVTFLFRIFALVDILLDEQIFVIFNRLAFLVYPLVFIIVLIGGYIAILVKLSRTDESESGPEHKEKTGEKLTWEEVGDEFRQTICDLLTQMRQSINKKK
jgi:hypothetical protein